MTRKKAVLAFFIFLVINFAALGIGGLFTTDGVSSEWYANLNKAPWTPSGWVFGAAWSFIMVCFSFYMTGLWSRSDNRKKMGLLFVIQLVLNISWNPIFFKFQNVTLGLAVISLLTILITYFLFHYRSLLKTKSVLVIPYFIWLLIATSLNAYILIQN